MPDLTSIAYVIVKLRDSPDVLSTIANFNNLEAAGFTAVVLVLIALAIKLVKWLFW